jgi:hypothetical protein
MEEMVMEKMMEADDMMMEAPAEGDEMAAEWDDDLQKLFNKILVKLKHTFNINER